MQLQGIHRESKDYFSEDDLTLCQQSPLLDPGTPTGLVNRLLFSYQLQAGSRAESVHDVPWHVFEASPKIQAGKRFYEIPLLPDKNHPKGTKILGKEKSMVNIIFELPNNPWNFFQYLDIYRIRRPQ